MTDMRSGSLSARRQAWGYGLAVGGPAALLPVLIPLRDTINLAGDVAVYLVLVVAAALVGGIGPALVAAAASAAVAQLLLHPAATTP